jgi:rare lipoprotein A
MKRILGILVLGMICVVSPYAQTYVRNFSQRGSATHEIQTRDLVAFHPSLPLNSRIVVTNLQNNKQIEVTIKGRIVPSGNRIVDLSIGAAIMLGMANKTLTAVSIEAARKRPAS